jgi:hypothetical protein
MSDCNYSELARNTVEFLKPYFIAAGGKLAQDGLNTAREKVFGWLKSKFIKPAQSAALEVATQAPHDPDALESLQHQIQRALEQQEEFRKELLAHLPKEILPPGIVQTANVTGDNNVTAQSTGSGSSINIQR